ncbi:MAG TPA: FAD-binding oxidoreductase [Ilumatobacter sp.]
MSVGHVELAGWGRTAPTTARWIELSAAALESGAGRSAIAGAGRGTIARGLGRAYGDAAQNAGGTVVRLVPADSEIDLDPVAGTARVGAGVGLDQLLRRIVPAGWFVPVTPGTRFVTVGGALAADVHGKNHHADRSFGHHVERFGIVLADGAHLSVTSSSHPDLWWATIGGMGLTGIITDVTFRLLPIETSSCRVATRRVPHLEALLELMEEGDHSHRYSVAWIDLLATGSHLGRAVLQLGDHATERDLAEHGHTGDPLAFAPSTLLTVPPLPNVMSRPAVRLFNEFWYRKAPAHHVGLESLTRFFHPLDGVGAWNRLYGRAGFVQYQFVVPFEAVGVLRAVIERVSQARLPSAITVLKRMGERSGGLLSFPQPGWTLTFDVSAATPGLPALLAELDRLVVAAGGRHYLAKDACTTPEMIRAGYPRLDEWKAIRRAVDPDGRWSSDLARRLDLL